MLAARVWGVRLPKAWERDLSAVVSKLRAALGRAGAGEIVSDAVSYQLRLPPDAQVDIPRARLAADAAERALEVSAEVYAGSGQFPAAVRALSEVLELEPFRETAGRRLMRVHLEAGNRAEGVRAYACRWALSP